MGGCSDVNHGQTTATASWLPSGIHPTHRKSAMDGTPDRTAARSGVCDRRCWAWCNGAAMADDGSKNDDKATGGGGKGALGELVKAESMIQLAIALPAGCVVRWPGGGGIGWVVGSWLDRHFHQEWISIVGILLGALAGFVQIFRTASRYLKNDRS